MSGGQRTGGHLSGNTLGYQIAIGTPPSSPGQPKKTTVPGLPLMARYSFTAAAAASEPAPSRLCPQPWPLAHYG